MNIIFIYALIDPRTDDIRYIGKTVNLKRRLKDHITHRNKSQTHCSRWIATLVDLGLKPVQIILDQVDDDGFEAERKWIAYGREMGWPLTNLTEGGEGILGHKHTDDSRAKMSAARKGRPISDAQREFLRGLHFGKPISAEHKARLLESTKGIPKSAEHRAKLSAAHTGKPLSAEHKAKLSAAHIGKKRAPHSEETKAKIAATETATKQKKKAARLSELQSPMEDK